MPEGARKGSGFIVVCTAPDVCLTPIGPSMVPVPYQIVAKVADASMPSPDVKFGGEPAVVVDASMVMSVIGNEAGVGGGIKSGHNRWIVEFDEGSSRVYVNGKRVVRHGDGCWMNGRNTRGKVICTDGMGPAPAPTGGAMKLPNESPDFPGTVMIKGSPSFKPVLPQPSALLRAALFGVPFCET